MSSDILSNDPATTAIYTLSLHDALPIYADDPTVSSWASGLRAKVLSFSVRKEVENGVFLRGRELVFRGSEGEQDRKSTRLNSSHSQISYAVFCLKKNKKVPDGRN